MDPLALYQLDPAAHGLKSEPFLCTAGCSPFITFYGLKHKNIRNIFTANKIPDPCHDKQCKGNLAGAKYSLCCLSQRRPTRTRSVFSCLRAIPPPSGDLEKLLQHKRRTLPLFPQTHF